MMVLPCQAIGDRLSLILLLGSPCCCTTHAVRFEKHERKRSPYSLETSAFTIFTLSNLQFRWNSS